MSWSGCAHALAWHVPGKASAAAPGVCGKVVFCPPDADPRTSLRQTGPVALMILMVCCPGLGAALLLFGKVLPKIPQYTPSCDSSLCLMPGSCAFGTVDPGARCLSSEQLHEAFGIAQSQCPEVLGKLSGKSLCRKSAACRGPASYVPWASGWHTEHYVSLSERAMNSSLLQLLNGTTGTCFFSSCLCHDHQPHWCCSNSMCGSHAALKTKCLLICQTSFQAPRKSKDTTTTTTTTTCRRQRQHDCHRHYHLTCATTAATATANTAIATNERRMKKNKKKRRKNRRSLKENRNDKEQEHNSQGATPAPKPEPSNKTNKKREQDTSCAKDSYRPIAQHLT